MVDIPMKLAKEPVTIEEKGPKEVSIIKTRLEKYYDGVHS